MQIYLRKITIITILILVGIVWTSRYSLCYRYYLWRLDHTTIGSDIEHINDEIRTMAEHIVPMLENTYKDTSKSDKNRSAAAWALIKVDRNKAETIFIPYLLEGNDEAILVRAIYDLGRTGSTNAYPAVLKYLKSSNPDVRRAVVTYLGQVNMPKSISLLQQIRQKDTSKDVSDEAAYRLQLLGLFPSK